MKSLVLKDLYNIGHNFKKTMLLLLVVFLFIFITNGKNGLKDIDMILPYISTITLLFSMMIITTFNFDDISKWNHYAMVTAITKKDIVLSKFIVLAIFNIVGLIMGVIFGIVGMSLLGIIDPTNTDNWKYILFLCPLILITSIFFGSISIPLIFKFGAEKARLLTIIAFALPSIIFIGILKNFQKLEITLTPSNNFFILISFLIIILFSIFFMFKLSYNIFSKQEF